MSYCTYNYDLLGEIVRRVSGTSLVDFCRERIFRPLGMVDMYYALPDSLGHRVVKRSLDAPVASLIAPWKILDAPWASFGACSTAMDVAIFGQMFLNRGTRTGMPASSARRRLPR
jgi:CubicO group peptidase (beta-lactamase class C family)